MVVGGVCAFSTAAMSGTPFNNIDWRLYQPQEYVIAGEEEFRLTLGGKTTVLHPAINVVVQAQTLTESARKHIEEVAAHRGMQVFSRVVSSRHPFEMFFFTCCSRDVGEKRERLKQTISQIPWAGNTIPAYTTGSGHDLLIPSSTVLMRLRDTVSQRDIAAKILNKDGVDSLIVRPELGANVVAVGVRSRAEALEISDAFSRKQDVMWSEPDFYRRLHFSSVPNDPLFPRQQYLHNMGQNDAVPGSDVDALRAWEISRGAADIVIAIVDDGVDIAHPDLRIAPGGYDFFLDNDNPSTEGVNAHGTGCAGVAAAIDNNDYLISGIAPECSILPVRIAGDDGFARDSVLAAGIRHAAEYADIINLSWGWPGDADPSVLREAVDFAVSEGRDGKGCPIFAATGNSATDWRVYRIPLSVLELPAGSYSFGFFHSTSPSRDQPYDWYWDTSDAATAMLDNVRLICGDDQYTVFWMEQFEGEVFPPEGWSTTENYPWEQTAENSYRGAEGRYSAQSGPTPESVLYTPLFTLESTETLAFDFRVESESWGLPDFGIKVIDEAGQIIRKDILKIGTISVQTHITGPAMYENVMAVGALTDCNVRADYSCYGSGLDIMAPSCGGISWVVTLDALGTLGYNDADYYPFFGGTSAASPLAAGIAGLLLATDSELTAIEVYHQMRRACEKVGGVEYDIDMPAGPWHEEYGYGLVNAFDVLTLPLEQPRTAVPDITEVDVEHAKVTLKRNHLAVGEIEYQHHDTVGAGLIVSQEPDAKKHVDVDTPVNMVVSLGREKSEVPDIIGMEEDAAMQEVQAAGFAVGFVTEEYCKDMRRGMVCDQYPEAGVHVAEGSYIDITVSQGRRLSGVLGCRGMQQEAAFTVPLTDIGIGVLCALLLIISSAHLRSKNIKYD